MHSMTISAKARPRGRGREKIDIAYRLRNIGWYWLVKNESGLSDDALDARYVHVNHDVRPRLFFQIRSNGSSPAETRGYRARKSLFEKVHEGGAYPAAKEWFESALWEMIAPPRIAAAHYSVIVQRIIEQRGWYRAKSEHSDIGRRFLGPFEPAFRGGRTPEYSSMLHFLGDSDRLDDLALLCALFRELHGKFLLDMLDDIHGLLVVRPTSLARSLRLPEWVGNLLGQLIADRVSSDFWYSTDELFQAAGPALGSGSRKEKSQRLLTWYAYGGGANLRHSDAQYPIVPRQPRLTWLEANRRTLALVPKLKPTITEPMPESQEEWEQIKQRQTDELVRDLGLDVPDRQGSGCLPLRYPMRNTFDWLLNPIFDQPHFSVLKPR